MTQSLSDTIARLREIRATCDAQAKTLEGYDVAFSYQAYEPMRQEHYKMMSTINALAEHVKTLRSAPEAAKKHLEYCGYGDSWERECAQEAKLEDKIEEALTATDLTKGEL